MLRSHPQIFMPGLKEPRWFATDLRERFVGAQIAPGTAPAAEPAALPLPRTLEQYLDLFEPAAAGQVVGEASPSYLRSTAAAGLIAEVRPDARIIAILREPAGFLRSLHMELVQNHVESEQDLRTALAGEQTGPDGLRRYTDRIAYVEQLRRYQAVFPAEQVLVLIYDDFRADNESTVRGVLRFLGVDETVELAVLEANPSVRVRSLRLDRLMRRVYAAQGPLARSVKDAIKTLTRSGRGGAAFGALRGRLLYAPPAAADEELTEELHRRFEPEVRALGEFLGRDLLTLWGYDRGR
jgi:hypothetical protein